MSESSKHVVEPTRASCLAVSADAPRRSSPTGSVDLVRVRDMNGRVEEARKLAQEHLNTESRPGGRAWLCPALLDYFESAPAHLWVRVQGLAEERP